MNKTFLIVLVVAAAIILAVVYSTRDVAPVDDNSAINAPNNISNMKIISEAFNNNGFIPSKYTCDSEKAVSPPLIFSDVPNGTKSLVLIADDPDVPKKLLPAGVFDHWVQFNISPTTTGIAAGTSAGTAGLNGTGKTGYVAPCPPPQYQPSEHRYIFSLYALDSILNLPAGTSKQKVLAAMQGHILEEARLIGKYDRAPKK